MDNQKSKERLAVCPQGLEGIATLTNDPLATYSLHGGRPSKSRANERKRS